MPTGCGTWPAYWTVGWDPWPDTGEIDIIEGANKQDHAHSALHTKKGCVMPSDTSKFNGYWSPIASGVALDCWVQATSDNTGCSIESYEDAYGEPLNRKGGGYYVMQLHHSKYIRIWFFARTEAPSDLTSGQPLPDLWTKTPLAYFTFGSNCNGAEFFKEQRIVINTTLCGGYAGWNFTYANGCPGNGLSDCETFVRNNPQQFREAYWEIQSVKVYRRQGQSCQTVTTPTTSAPITTTFSYPSWEDFWTTTGSSNDSNNGDSSGGIDGGGSGSGDGSSGSGDGSSTITSTSTAAADNDDGGWGNWWPWPSEGGAPGPCWLGLLLLLFMAVLQGAGGSR
ncbi:PAN domain-containing protein, putative [Eimeria brunetti]|uniref:PAN domain-containing protein, putative n=1 Tax=Eimeria brunetti TaxID=51314 RepID=U6LGV7_9EIME|nr:PAN domain-containing protein, putative [Eimeria brunetti]